MRPTRSRRTPTQDFQCPICLTTFDRATTSMSDYNIHVNRCSEAQFQYAVKVTASQAAASYAFNSVITSSSSSSSNNGHNSNNTSNGSKIVQNLGINEKDASSAEEERKARAKSLIMLKEGGPLGDTFNSILLHHLGGED